MDDETITISDFFHHFDDSATDTAILAGGVYVEINAHPY